MAWTTPKTWSAGEALTADLMNEQLSRCSLDVLELVEKGVPCKPSPEVIAEYIQQGLEKYNKEQIRFGLQYGGILQEQACNKALVEALKCGKEEEFVAFLLENQLNINLESSELHKTIKKLLCDIYRANHYLDLLLELKARGYEFTQFTEAVHKRFKASKKVDFVKLAISLKLPIDWTAPDVAELLRHILLKKSGNLEDKSYVFELMVQKGIKIDPSEEGLKKTVVRALSKGKMGFAKQLIDLGVTPDLEGGAVVRKMLSLLARGAAQDAKLLYECYQSSKKTSSITPKKSTDTEI